MSDDLKRLAGRIEALKDAGAFNAKERAEAVLTQTMVILTDFEKRLRALEKR